MTEVYEENHNLFFNTRKSTRYKATDTLNNIKEETGEVITDEEKITETKNY